MNPSSIKHPSLAFFFLFLMLLGSYLESHQSPKSTQMEMQDQFNYLDYSQDSLLDREQLAPTTDTLSYDLSIMNQSVQINEDEGLSL